MSTIKRLVASRQVGSRGYSVFMLLLSLGIFAGFSALGFFSAGCTGSDYANSALANLDILEGMLATLNAKDAYTTGDRVELELAGHWFTSGNGAITWSPPPGATSFSFPDIQPEPGGPPFVFKNLTHDQAYAGIQVAYNAPPPSEQNPGSFRDTITIEHGPREETYHSHHYRATSAAALSAPTAQGWPLVSPQAVKAVNVWKINRFADFESQMTQAACQDLVAQGKSANEFIAIRLPVADALLPNQAYLLPVVFSDTLSPKQILQVGPANIEMPLETRQDATIWANENLPAAPGELWLALGIQPDAVITCPVMDRPNYSRVLEAYLDLSGRPNNCQDCVLPIAACYKTAAAASQSAAGDPGGFTCLGPSPFKLTKTSDWKFEQYTTLLSLKPNDAIEVHYWIQNDATAARTFDLSLSSTLGGVTWVVHPGQTANPFAPDHTQTIGAQVVAPGSDWFHLYITGTVPAGTAPGQYSVSMTAANAGMNPTTWTNSTALVVSASGSLPEQAPPLPGVALSGSAVRTLRTAGEPLTYTFTVTNSGAQPLTALVLSDTLPANTTYVSCADGDSCLNSSGTVTWNLANLGTGQSRSFTLVVQSAAGLPDGTLLTNSAYSVQTGQSVSANGTAVVTLVGLPLKIYVPMIRH